ncbi:MAG: SiaC family regulatory phosphoprotein [Flavobacteriales bacterium]
MSNSLHLEATATTPEILFDTESCQFIVRGKSIIVDALHFYNQTLQWIETHASDIQSDARILISMSYFSSSSQKALLLLLRKFKEVTDGKMQVTWDVMEEDEFMQEAGESMSELLDMPFHYNHTSGE